MKAFYYVLVLEMLAMIACVCVGLYNFRTIRGSARLFILQAALGLCMECIGYLSGKGGASNHIYFNVFIVFEFLVMLFAAKDYLKGIFLPLALAGSVVFGLVLVYDLIRIGPFFASFHAYTIAWIVLGTVYLIVLLRQLLQHNQSPVVGVNVIAVMVISYYFCTIPGMGLIRYLLEKSSISEGINISVLSTAMCVIRYSGTAAGLWWIAKSVREVKAAPAMRQGDFSRLKG